MKIINRLKREVAYFVFGNRRHNKDFKDFARSLNGKKILEIGSGEDRSAKGFFNSSNEFVQSDIVPDYKHRIIDVTKMDYKNEFDVVLCSNVLEHVFDFKRAIKNIHNALKPGGVLIVGSPAFYPLHNEPEDYWRFTEYGIRRLLADFSKVSIKRTGAKRYPFTYYVKAIK